MHPRGGHRVHVRQLQYKLCCWHPAVWVLLSLIQCHCILWCVHGTLAWMIILRSDSRRMRGG